MGYQELNIRAQLKLKIYLHHDCSHRGSLHIYGHSHHSLPEYGRSMDIGWCKYRRPLHIDEIYDILSKRPINFVDHHGKDTNP